MRQKYCLLCRSFIVPPQRKRVSLSFLDYIINLALVLTRSLALSMSLDGALSLVSDADEVLAELFRDGGRLLRHDRVLVHAHNQGCKKKSRVKHKTTIFVIFICGSYSCASYMAMVVGWVDFDNGCSLGWWANPAQAGRYTVTHLIDEN